MTWLSIITLFAEAPVPKTEKRKRVVEHYARDFFPIIGQILRQYFKEQPWEIREEMASLAMPHLYNHLVKLPNYIDQGVWLESRDATRHLFRVVKNDLLNALSSLNNRHLRQDGPWHASLDEVTSQWRLNQNPLEHVLILDSKERLREYFVEHVRARWRVLAEVVWDKLDGAGGLSLGDLEPYSESDIELNFMLDHFRIVYRHGLHRLLEER
jgi:hypothetical protein